jgi:outer membrane protein assembly factor BamE (lipoprotein component of BamABCDE complex)
MKTFLAAVLASALLAGCAAHRQVRDWWTLSEQSFSGIRPGATDKADVERQVGAPVMVTSFPRQDEEVWDYRYLNGTREYAAEVHFDAQGKAKYVATYPDLCPFHPVPCR